MDDTIMNTYEWMLVEKGRVEGQAEGREEGRVEGRVEGRADGRLAAAREILADLLMERFGRSSWSMGNRLAAISDEAELRRLARVAVKVSTLADFEHELRDA